MTASDVGYFGPESVSWRVHSQTTVLFGGARALLMQAAHPLVIAGARQTGFYQRNPWKRLERTLELAYTITFGSKEQALRAAGEINDVHARVNGIDEITGKHYDAFDPSLLLWVHACLVDSALLFEHLTVGALTAADQQRFHEEQMLGVELLGLPRSTIPPTYRELRAYIDRMVASDEILVTDSALQVADIIVHPPPEAEYKPVLRAISWWAFGTLPARLRSMYGIRWTVSREAALQMSLAALRMGRPLLPRRFRVILPAAQAQVRAGVASDGRGF
jgi:uncharacterized protein (DUF2236 family)